MGPDVHAADHGPAHSHGDAAPGHGTRESYLTGFGLSVVLTAIPFIIVMTGIFGTALTAFLVLGLGVIQIIVHTFYFLHMNSKSENGWTMLAMIFTVVLVLITLTGSLWIMFHLNENMMAPSLLDLRQAP